MVPSDSAPVATYSTSIDTIVISVTIYAIFHVHFDDLGVGQFKLIQSSAPLRTLSQPGIWPPSQLEIRYASSQTTLI